MTDEWYNAPIVRYVGKGLILTTLVGTIGFGLVSCNELIKTNLLREQTKNGYQMNSSELNGNNIPEESYQNAFLSIDGKSLECKLIKK